MKTHINCFSNIFTTPSSIVGGVRATVIKSYHSDFGVVQVSNNNYTLAGTTSNNLICLQFPFNLCRWHLNCRDVCVRHCCGVCCCLPCCCKCDTFDLTGQRSQRASLITAGICSCESIHTYIGYSAEYKSLMLFYLNRLCYCLLKAWFTITNSIRFFEIYVN